MICYGCPVPVTVCPALARALQAKTATVPPASAGESRSPWAVARSPPGAAGPRPRRRATQAGTERSRAGLGSLAPAGDATVSNIYWAFLSGSSLECKHDGPGCGSVAGPTAQFEMGTSGSESS